MLNQISPVHAGMLISREQLIALKFKFQEPGFYDHLVHAYPHFEIWEIEYPLTQAISFNYTNGAARKSVTYTFLRVKITWNSLSERVVNYSQEGNSTCHYWSKEDEV